MSTTAVAPAPETYTVDRARLDEKLARALANALVAAIRADDAALSDTLSADERAPILRGAHDRQRS